MVAERRGVKVIHGANDGFFEVAGATVRRLQGSLVDAFNIPDDALALVNGRRVPRSYELRGNDVLEFIGEYGVKGAGKKTNLTEDDLNRLGFAVVGDTAVPIEDATPDESWEPSRLEAYATGRLARSRQAEQESILQAHKSAVDLFWAGCAFKIIRGMKKAERHGAWTEWKRERGLHDTTVNDAIRLYENAKTPDALIGLGVTEAKEKFVYPFKDQGDDEEAKPSQPQPKKRTAKTRGAGKGPSTRKSPVAPDDSHEDDDQGNSGDGDEPVIEPTRTLTTELEEIAQRLNEIAQDDMGKIDWSEEDPARFQNAAAAVMDAISNIYTRMNNDLPTS